MSDPQEDAAEKAARLPSAETCRRQIEALRTIGAGEIAIATAEQVELRALRYENALIREREAAAYREGAKAMRDDAARVVDEADWSDPQSVYEIAVDIRSLSLPPLPAKKP